MKVSVIIPCYNVELYVEKAVMSIFSQSYTNLELICINDGSTDNTKFILEALKEKAPFEMIIMNKENEGASKSRNVGVGIAKGEYYQFLDADDWLSEGKIENQVKIALKNNLPAIVIGSYRKINEKGKELEVRRYEKEARKEKLIWDRLMSPDLGNTCSNLFNAVFFNEGGAWNDNLKSSQEYTLMFEILKFNQNVVFDSEVNTIIVQRKNGSISLNDVRGNHERYLRLRISIKQYLESKNITFNENSYNQVVFDRIRILYKSDKILAKSYFKSTIPKSFRPSVTIVTNRTYIIFYKFLGFTLTEKLKALFK